MMFTRKVRWIWGLFALLGSTLAQAQTPARSGSVFRPDDFPSLGDWDLTSGDVTIDTDALTITDVTGTGSLGVSESGQTDVAAFCFDSISLTGGSVTITGSRPLALLS
ncbi:hypothetical protein HQ520_10565, partial [bacterium]|nr:hypothetical protein [bacterium]